jgi:hypothetical protein
MRRMKPALLGLLLLGLATAAWAVAPAAPIVPASATPAVATPASPADALPTGLFNPTPNLSFTCTIPPTTVCTSCFDFGVKSSYQCTTYCLNGVLHRSCNTCGEGCND